MNSLKIGDLELFPVEAGRFMLDGGAMFGVVPKTLWSRQIPADDKNRIPMAMRCLVVKSASTGKIYLIDNGSGHKFDEKMEKIYSLDYQHSDLLSSLKAIGLKPEDITDMVFSHLHFDHCGGTTRFDESGNLKEVFPNAAYHVNERHWETANHPNAREKASFFSENIEPIKHSGRLNLVKDHHEFENGFKTMPMDGHTIGQQLPVFSDKNLTIVFAADLIPTFAHVPLPWVMGYDMAPVQTLKEKETFLKMAAEQGWYLFLEHDATHEIITVQSDNGKFRMDKSLTLSEIS
ncbi:MAG: MBL fold metallo-hydrolase [Balneolaceae bacterium]|nr:MAG: MBL fold metallo-hydrolase [Balneolaceae bacterium]